MALIEVLQYEGDNSTFVWKHPQTDFNTGSQLIVHESQEAIFMLNGEILDSFKAGKHTLTTENLPFIKGLMKTPTDGQSAFHAELYFVNLTTQMAVRWGTDSKMFYQDPVYKFPLEIGACGEMALTVDSARKLLVKIVGTESHLSQEKMVSYLRSFVMNRIKSVFPAVVIDKNISVFEIDTNLQVLSEAIEDKLKDDFYDYGINLRKFLITVVVKPDDDKNFIEFKNLHYQQYTAVTKAQLEQKVAVIEQQTKAQQTVIESEALARKRQLEGFTYQQEKGFEVAQKMAENEAVGQMSNLGIGLGMMAGVGGAVGQTVGNMTGQAMNSVNTAPPAEEKRFCTSCGSPITAGVLFCEQCGAKQESVPTAACANCGHVFTNDAKFCPKCGTKRG